MKKTVKVVTLLAISVPLLFVSVIIFRILHPSTIGWFELREESEYPLRVIDENALDDFPIFEMMRYPYILDRFDISLTNESTNPIQFVAGSRERLDDVAYESSLENNTLVLNEPQERFYVVVENFLTHSYGGNLGDLFSPRRETFILKLFYNLESIPFRIDNQSYYAEEFVFRLAVGYQVHIPVYLDSSIEADTYLNSLTVGLFASPQYHTTNQFGDLNIRWPDLSSSHQAGQYELSNVDLGIVRHFQVSFGGNETVAHPSAFSEFNQFECRYCPSFGVVTRDTLLDGILERTINTSPSSPITARQGEEIELLFGIRLQSPTRADAEFYPPVENYAIIALLNWEQVSLSGLPYLFFEQPDIHAPGEFDQSIMYITAPDDLGFYEFIAFAVANPNQGTHHKLADELRGAWTPVSLRFTIEVVE